MEVLLLLEQFLNNKLSFKQGVKLYEQLGGSPVLLNLFKTEDDFARKKLRTELQKRFNSLNNKTTVLKSGPVKSPKKRNDINPDILPNHLKTEYLKLGPIIRQISFLHAKLEEKNNSTDRYKLAVEIIDLAKQRRTIYTRLDYFIDHNRDMPGFELVKEAADLKDTPYFEALHKLQLLRVRRTKLKKLPARIKDYEKVVDEIKILEEIVKKNKNQHA